MIFSFLLLFCFCPSLSSVRNYTLLITVCQTSVKLASWRTCSCLTWRGTMWMTWFRFNIWGCVTNSRNSHWRATPCVSLQTLLPSRWSETWSIWQIYRIKSCWWFAQQNRHEMRFKVHSLAHTHLAKTRYTSLSLGFSIPSPITFSWVQIKAGSVYWKLSSKNTEEDKSRKEKRMAVKSFQWEKCFTALLYWLWQKVIQTPPYISVALLVQSRATAVTAWLYLKQKVWFLIGLVWMEMDVYLCNIRSFFWSLFIDLF